MKKISIATGLMMAVTTFATAQTTTQTTNMGNAQYLSLGPVIGFGDNWVGNMKNDVNTNTGISTTTKSRFMPAGYVGIGLVYAKNEHWGLGGQLTIGTEGYKMDYTTSGEFSRTTTTTYTATPLYLRMPLRAYYFFGDYRNTVRPKIYLGPSFGLKVAESDKVENGTENMADVTGTFRTFDFGINAGAGVNIKLAKSIWLNMDLGYYQGLLDAVKDPAGKYNVNHDLGFNAGVLFGIK